MIADDDEAIRKAMKVIDWQKKCGEVDARMKASKQPSTDLPKPKPLFDYEGPPWRGPLPKD